MTIVYPSSEPPKQVARRGNGKTTKEILAREERKIQVQQMQVKVEEARAAADDLARITQLRAEQKARVFDRYGEQESKRATQVQIDQPIVLYVLIGLAIVTFLTTALLTADGTIGAAASAKFAFPAFGFVLFGAFEVAILAFMLMYYVLGSRIDYDGNPVKAERWFWAMVAASMLTVGLSVYHVLDLYKYDVTNIDMWVGIGIRVAVAVFFVLISKGVANVIFAKAVRL